MTLGQFKVALLAKSSGRYKAGPDAFLLEKIYEGQKLIAKETVPQYLLVTGETATEDVDQTAIMRRLDVNSYIKFPFRDTVLDPVDSTIVSMDIALEDALQYYVIASLETQKAQYYMGKYHSEIDLHNDNMIQTELTVASNESDADRFYQFEGY